MSANAPVPTGSYPTTATTATTATTGTTASTGTTDIRVQAVAPKIDRKEFIYSPIIDDYSDLFLFIRNPNLITILKKIESADIATKRQGMLELQQASKTDLDAEYCFSYLSTIWDSKFETYAEKTCLSHFNKTTELLVNLGDKNHFLACVELWIIYSNNPSSEERPKGELYFEKTEQLAESAFKNNISLAELLIKKRSSNNFSYGIKVKIYTLLNNLKTFIDSKSGQKNPKYAELQYELALFDIKINPTKTASSFKNDYFQRLKKAHDRGYIRATLELLNIFFDYDIVYKELIKIVNDRFNALEKPMQDEYKDEMDFMYLRCQLIQDMNSFNISLEKNKGTKNRENIEKLKNFIKQCLLKTDERSLRLKAIAIGIVLQMASIQYLEAENSELFSLVEKCKRDKIIEPNMLFFWGKIKEQQYGNRIIGEAADSYILAMNQYNCYAMIKMSLVHLLSDNPEIAVNTFEMARDIFETFAPKNNAVEEMIQLAKQIIRLEKTSGEFKKGSNRNIELKYLMEESTKNNRPLALCLAKYNLLSGRLNDCEKLLSLASRHDNQDSDNINKHLIRILIAQREFNEKLKKEKEAIEQQYRESLEKSKKPEKALKHEGTLRNLESDKKDLTEKNRKLAEKMKAQSKEIESLREKNAETERSFHDLQTEREALDKKLAELKDSLEIASKEKEASGLNASSLQRNLDTLKADKSKLEGDLAKEKSNNLAELRKEHKKLETALRKQKEESDLLKKSKAQLNDVTSKLNATTTKVEELGKIITQQKKDFELEKDSLKSENTRVMDENAKLKNENTKLNEENSKIQAQFEKWRIDIDTLRGQLASIITEKDRQIAAKDEQISMRDKQISTYATTARQNCTDIADLEQKLAKALKKIGTKKEKQPFLPAFSVGRPSSAAPLHTRSFTEAPTAAANGYGPAGTFHPLTQPGYADPTALNTGMPAYPYHPAISNATAAAAYTHTPIMLDHSDMLYYPVDSFAGRAILANGGALPALHAAMPPLPTMPPTMAPPTTASNPHLPNAAPMMGLPINADFGQETLRVAPQMHTTAATEVTTATADNEVSASTKAPVMGMKSQ